LKFSNEYFYSATKTLLNFIASICAQKMQISNPSHHSVISFTLSSTISCQLKRKRFPRTLSGILHMYTQTSNALLTTLKNTFRPNLRHIFELHIQFSSILDVKLEMHIGQIKRVRCFEKNCMVYFLTICMHSIFLLLLL